MGTAERPLGGVISEHPAAAGRARLAGAWGKAATGCMRVAGCMRGAWRAALTPGIFWLMCVFASSVRLASSYSRTPKLYTSAFSLCGLRWRTSGLV